MANSGTYNHTKVHFTEGAAPTTPDAGERAIYAKTDGMYEIDDAGVETKMADGSAAHIADAADAHDASAVSVLDTAANFTGTDVEAVLAELQDNIDAVASTYVGCNVYHNTTQSINTGEVVLFNSEDYDTDAIHSTASNTGRFTVPAGMGGKWKFRPKLFIPSGTAGQVRFQLRIDGTTAVNPEIRTVRDAAASVTLHGELTVILAAAQYVEVLFGEGFAGAVTIGSTTASAYNYMEAEFAGA